MKTENLILSIDERLKTLKEGYVTLSDKADASRIVLADFKARIDELESLRYSLIDSSSNPSNWAETDVHLYDFE